MVQENSVFPASSDIHACSLTFDFIAFFLPWTRLFSPIRFFARIPQLWLLSHRLALELFPPSCPIRGLSFWLHFLIILLSLPSQGPFLVANAYSAFLTGRRSMPELFRLSIMISFPCGNPLSPSIGSSSPPGQGIFTRLRPSTHPIPSFPASRDCPLYRVPSPIPIQTSSESVPLQVPSNSFLCSIFLLQGSFSSPPQIHQTLTLVSPVCRWSQMDSFFCGFSSNPSMLFA